MYKDYGLVNKEARAGEWGLIGTLQSDETPPIQPAMIRRRMIGAKNRP
jgi:hypothetical protein